MFKLLHKPSEFDYIAVSGGIDSMVLLDFICNGGGHKKVVLHFNHGTEYGYKAHEFVHDYCFAKDIPFICGKIQSPKLPSQSWEEYWREERYMFFNKFKGKNIALAHHLGDATETYIFNCLHGNPDWIMPASRDNVVRPLLTTPKSEIEDWANRKSVPYMDDPSNENTDYMRCAIRHELMPKCKKVNPGIETVVKKKVEEWCKNNVLTKQYMAV
jgi:tRNA(Ile)-lysidine synthase